MNAFDPRLTMMLSSGAHDCVFTFKDYYMSTGTDFPPRMCFECTKCFRTRLVVMEPYKDTYTESELRAMNERNMAERLKYNHIPQHTS
jgi:hypothetical protein